VQSFSLPEDSNKTVIPGLGWTYAGLGVECCDKLLALLRKDLHRSALVPHLLQG